ncbi:hypothetical protein SK128_022164 [Halocaridina rubra]|uniref:Non-structural maintenance of chromosomes element 1 homolog n=1 Tax=Halocaridina rubra TaxID=373956 RepID=A0AAN9A408_HALRR
MTEDMAAPHRYTDAHRMFLQILTAKRILLASEVKSSFEKCCAEYEVNGIDLKDFVMAINREVSAMGLCIKRYLQEDALTDCNCYVLVNTVNTEASKHASPFTPQQFSLLKMIIGEIVDSSDGTIKETTAENMGAHMNPRMKVSDAEVAIDHFVRNRWLLKHEDGDVTLSLSALALAELENYLEEGYDGIRCSLCSFITFRGYTCTSCNLKFHRLCSGKYWNQANSQPVCPGSDCNAPWPHVQLNLSSSSKRHKNST